MKIFTEGAVCKSRLSTTFMEQIFFLPIFIEFIFCYTFRCSVALLLCCLVDRTIKCNKASELCALELCISNELAVHQKMQWSDARWSSLIPSSLHKMCGKPERDLDVFVQILILFSWFILALLFFLLLKRIHIICWCSLFCWMNSWNSKCFGQLIKLVWSFELL